MRRNILHLYTYHVISSDSEKTIHMHSRLAWTTCLCIVFSSFLVEMTGWGRKRKPVRICEQAKHNIGY
jgi:hypothetical protein